TGRYVRVQLHGAERLQLAEVQVGGPTFEIQPDVIPSWGVRGTYPSLSDNIDAEIFAIEQIGNTLYVGGRFQEAIPTRFAAGEDQPFLMALDATTGDFVSTFRPRLNGAVLALEASPDGSRLFVGGEFYSVNDEPDTGGLVALDPVTGLVQQDWVSHLNRYWTVGAAQVRNLEIAGGDLYAVGAFTHATDIAGIRTNVYNVARFDLATSQVDTAWRPNVSGGTVWGLAVNEGRDRVYLGGKFTTVDGLSRESFAAVTRSTGTVVDPAVIARNSTGQDDIYDVVATDDFVVIAGSEHSTIVYDADDFSIVNWVFTSSPGGDNQDLEIVGDRIYSLCHCRGPVYDDYRPGANWTQIAQGTFMGVTEGVYAVSAKTGAFIDSFPHDQFEDEWVVSAGGWAVHGAPDGCLWLGGDFNLAAIGDPYVNSLARVCLEGGPRPLGLQNPTPPPADATPPPAPVAATVATSGTDVIVSITPPADTSDVAHYAVTRDGVTVVKTSGESVTLTDQPVGNHTYGVMAEDASGNASSVVEAGGASLVPGSYDRFVDATFDNYFESQEYGPFAFELGVFGDAKPDRAVPMYSPDGAPTDEGAAVLILGGKVLSGTPAVTDMAGAFTTTFTLAEATPVSIRLDRRIYTSAAMGTLYVRMRIDGADTTLASRSNNGFTEPWTTDVVSLGTLAAGTHTLSLGGWLDSKSSSFANWWNRIAFDDVLVYSDRPGLEVLDAPVGSVTAASLPVTVATSDRVTLTSLLTVEVTPSWTGVPVTAAYDSTTGNFGVDLDLTAAADGAQSYVVSVADADGHETTEVVSFDLVNDAPPSVTIDSPLEGETVTGSVDVVVDAVDVFDPAGTLNVEVSSDGASWTAAPWDAATERYGTTLDVSGEPDGPLTVHARATDSDDLVGSATVGVEIDNSEPTIDEVVARDGAGAYWRLGELAGTVANDSIGSLNATYVGGPTLGVPGLVVGSDTAVSFDGTNDGIDVPDATFINTGSPKTAASVEAWFSTSGVASRQVIYEQGGATRGAAIYVDGGLLYGGYWNVADDSSADTPWVSGPAFVSTPVLAETTYHVVLTFDQGGDVVAMYLDGVEVGSVSSIGTLFPHGSDIGIGAMNDSIRFHDGTASGDGFRFSGVIDEVAVYPTTLSSSMIADHVVAGRGTASQPPSVSFVAPLDGGTVSGVVTVAVAASDPEDPAADLIVDVSTDGGGSWTPAVFDVASGEHRMDVDTTVISDGPLSLLARVTDTAGLTGTAEIAVITDNGIGPAYQELVALDGASTYWRLGDANGTTAVDSISAVNGTYVGGAGLGAPGLLLGGDTAVVFDGVDDGVELPDSSLLNTVLRTTESVEAWFSVSDTAARQVIYDQGGTSRGLVMYVDGGR
ncbi:MAG: LamG domain-containing protein, partial [Acidimicrobiia bacterium]|nr:LamG domain-containing protein [Acidimicrobiia bacterium]